jgi:CRISPR/Cas system-associated endonuclease Cas1
MLGRGFVPHRNKDGLLTTGARKKMIQGFIKRWRKEMAWRSRKISPDRILAAQARDLGAFFLREEKYQPFRMRW